MSEKNSQNFFIQHLLSSCRSFWSSALKDSSCLLPPIWPIKKFAEIEEKVKIDSSTLLLLDIDNTLLTPTGDCGTIEHFTHLYKTEMLLKRCSEIEAKIATHKRWMSTHSLIRMRLVDDKVHEFMKGIKKTKALTLGFTARLPSMKEITLYHLQQHHLSFDLLEGLSFNKIYQLFPPTLVANGQSKQNYFPFDNHLRRAQALFAEGVIFCHDLNEKGMVLNDFLKVFRKFCQSKGLPFIKKIIFVDDGAHNFLTMQKTTLNHNLEFYGFHFQFQNSFNAKRAEQEELFLIHQLTQLAS